MTARKSLGAFPFPAKRKMVLRTIDTGATRDEVGLPLDEQRNTPVDNKDGDGESCGGALPGFNPYDGTRLSYKEASERENAALIIKKNQQAAIEIEKAQIALDKERLELQRNKGELIPKADYLSRQEIIISTFKEVLSLVVTESSIRVPAPMRSEYQEDMASRVNAALSSIAQSVVDRLPRDAVVQNMLEAFKGK